MADIIEMSLEEIWSMKSDSIDILLIELPPYLRLTKVTWLSPDNTLFNKIKVAQLLNRRDQLVCERSIINHPLFEKISLKLGRLEDIKAKIMVLIYLEPIFNEKALITMINDYNPIYKIYLIGINKIYVIDFNGCSNVVEISLKNSLQYKTPFYCKNKLYLANPHECNIVSVDLSSLEEKQYQSICPYSIIGGVGNFLYYQDFFRYNCLSILDLQIGHTLNTDLGWDDEILLIDDLLYTFRSTPDSIVISTHKCGSSFEFMDSRVFPIKSTAEMNDYSLSTNNKVLLCYNFQHTLEAYDFQTSELLAVHELHVIKIHNYHDRIYLVASPISHLNWQKSPTFIYVFENKTFKSLGILGKQTTEVVNVVGCHNKLALTYLHTNGASLNVYDLDSSSQDPCLILPYTGNGNFTIG
jgi:hypothetical protein